MLFRSHVFPLLAIAPGVVQFAETAVRAPAVAGYYGVKGVESAVGGFAEQAKILATGKTLSEEEGNWWETAGSTYAMVYGGKSIDFAREAAILKLPKSTYLTGTGTTAEIKPGYARSIVADVLGNVPYVKTRSKDYIAQLRKSDILPETVTHRSLIFDPLSVKRALGFYPEGYEGTGAWARRELRGLTTQGIKDTSAISPKTEKIGRASCRERV